MSELEVVECTNLADQSDVAKRRYLVAPWPGWDNLPKTLPTPNVPHYVHTGPTSTGGGQAIYAGIIAPYTEWTIEYHDNGSATITVPYR